MKRLLVLAFLPACAMRSAAATGEQAASLARDVPAVASAVELCELEGLAKGLSAEEVCAGLRGEAREHEKALILLAAYGTQLAALASAKGPEGRALATSVLEALEPDGLDDYTDLIANASDAFVDLVASGWVRAEIRKNVDVHEKTILSVAFDELVFAREALADAAKIDAEVCRMLDASAAEIEALEESSLGARRYGWPMGANLLRLQAHERRRQAASLEVKLYGFMLATVHLAKWARKDEGYRDDAEVQPRIEAAVGCAAWDVRNSEDCRIHRERLDVRLGELGLDAPARAPDGGEVIIRRCGEILAE